ncbi:helix-turn-helix domain-containing protein [Ancylobacter sp.]|uniref:helix-turn-helix domain-containing protein n=1 Tax=Ancylobacter sp. TaxID=1872567 RepID=UPI003C7C57DC
MVDERQKMREGIALEYGIALYRQYGEEQAAHFLNIDVSTLKRWRRRGITPHIRMGERGVRYLGQHIVDLLLKGTEGWDDAQQATSGSESGSLPGEVKAPHGIGAASTKRPDGQTVTALAQQTFRKPSKS